MMIIMFLEMLLFGTVAHAAALPNDVKRLNTDDWAVATNQTSTMELVSNNYWPAFTTYSKPGCDGSNQIWDLKHTVPPSTCEDRKVSHSTYTHQLSFHDALGPC